MKEIISSLHDDVFVPKATGHLGEYKNYPERFEPNEKSVITRLEQFGVNINDIEDVFGKKIIELTEEEYNMIMAEAIKGQYDTIVSSVFDQYMFPSPESPQDNVRMEKMLGLIKQFEKMDAQFGVNLIKRKDDFDDRENLVLALEAGSHLIKSVADASDLADKGIKIFGLQYGKDNTLIQSDALTSLGKEVVQEILSKNLIIDLAHTGFKARQELIALAREMEKGHQLSYTHGSAVDDLIDSWKGKVGKNRLLTHEEIREIIEIGGIIGLGVSKPFFENTRKVAERIDNIAQLDGGIDRIAIGTDFGGVAPEWLNEIKKPEDFHVLGECLSHDFGMKDEDIMKIIKSNAKNWIRKAID